MPADYFHRLGLPRRFSVVAEDLERAYLQAASAAHPDANASDGDAARKAGVTVSAEINAAYTTLKDPVKRAEHLLELHGGPAPGADKGLPPALLMQVMEYREAADEARANHSGLDVIIAQVEQALAGVMQKVATMLDKDTVADSDKAQVRKLLNAARTWQSLLRDCEAD